MGKMIGFLMNYVPVFKTYFVMVGYQAVRMPDSAP